MRSLAVRSIGPLLRISLAPWLGWMSRCTEDTVAVAGDGFGEAFSDDGTSLSAKDLLSADKASIDCMRVQYTAFLKTVLMCSFTATVSTLMVSSAT